MEGDRVREERKVPDAASVRKATAHLPRRNQDTSSDDPPAGLDVRFSTVKDKEWYCCVSLTLVRVMLVILSKETSQDGKKHIQNDRKVLDLFSGMFIVE
ncbi:hypothetical protein PoB_004884500 [Plakobranchus ocellatus]|uniref:Uncharacterized protein n=1 Tax=Plakobranchus ocellatus TaxID=259542 RepID=A0AAV4BSR7_9GAST|nr:hypothetical protein PoB_004884500 [Plakobranchus ocellatus]